MVLRTTFHPDCDYSTFVERSTNFLMMEKLKQGKKAMPLARTVWRLLLPYKATLRTITTDISKVSDARITAIKKKINARPREKLNFLTPKEVFYKNFP